MVPFPSFLFFTSLAHSVVSHHHSYRRFNLHPPFLSCISSFLFFSFHISTTIPIYFFLLSIYLHTTHINKSNSNQSQVTTVYKNIFDIHTYIHICDVQNRN